MTFFRQGYVANDNFPLKELACIFVPQFASAVSISSLFPYIGLMIVHLQMSTTIEAAGYYAGYASSSIMFGRIISSLLWGKLSDKYGRKLIMCVCCISITVSTLLFGFSSKFWMAIATRLCFGFFTPIVGTARTIVSEICSTKHAAAGIGSICGAWFLGLTAGPMIGSLLARPCELYPKTFLGHITVFQNYPYLLPNLVCSTLGLISFFIVLFWLPETLPSTANGELRVVGDAEYVAPSSSNAVSHHCEEYERDIRLQTFDFTKRNIQTTSKEVAKKQETSVCSILRREGVFRVILAYALIAGESLYFDGVFPLWAMSSSFVGGLNFNIRMVGLSTSITGFFLLGYILFIYPPLANFLGSHKSFVVGQVISGSLILLICLSSQALASPKKIFGWIVASTTLMKMSYELGLCGILIIINNLVEARERGLLNGFVVTIDSIAKMFGLAYGPVLYAWSIERTRPFPFDFHFTFVVLFLLSYISCGVFLSTMHCKSRHSHKNCVADMEVTNPIANECAVADTVGSASIDLAQAAIFAHADASMVTDEV